MSFPPLGSLRLNISALVGLLRFALVGASGVLVNLVALAAVLHVTSPVPGGFVQAAGETLATQIAIFWNFALTEFWVFPTAGPTMNPWARLAGYWLISMAALAIQLPLAAGLTRLGLGYVLATGVSLGLLVVGRYTVCRALLYRSTPQQTPADDPFAPSPAVFEGVA